MRRSGAGRATCTGRGWAVVRDPLSSAAEPPPPRRSCTHSPTRRMPVQSGITDSAQMGCSDHEGEEHWRQHRIWKDFGGMMWQLLLCLVLVVAAKKGAKSSTERKLVSEFIVPDDIIKESAACRVSRLISKIIPQLRIYSDT